MKEYKRSIIVFQIMNFFYWSAMFLHTPTLSTYAKNIGASSQMVGLIIGGYGFSQMLLRLPFGLLSDRWRTRKVFVVIGMAMVGLGGLLSAVCPTPWGLFVSRLVTGIGASAWVNCTVLFPAYYPPEQTGQAVSRINTCCALATCVAVLLGGWAVELWGQVAAGYLAGACGLMAFLLSFGIADHRPEPRHPLKFEDVKRVLLDKRLWCFSIMSLVFQTLWHGTSNCFTPILAQRFDVSSTQLGYMSSIGSLGQLTGSAIIGMYVLPKLKPRLVFGAGFLLLAAIIAATAFSSAYLIMVVLLFLAGMIGFSIHLCAVTNSVKEMPDELRGIAMGMVQAIYGIGMFIGPSGLGQLLGFVSLEHGYLAVSTMCVVTAILGIFWAKD